MITTASLVASKASMPAMKKVKSYHYRSDEAASYLRRER